jgi:hypothetical protein
MMMIEASTDAAVAAQFLKNVEVYYKDGENGNPNPENVIPFQERNPGSIFWWFGKIGNDRETGGCWELQGQPERSAGEIVKNLENEEVAGKPLYIGVRSAFSVLNQDEDFNGILSTYGFVLGKAMGYISRGVEFVRDNDSDDESSSALPFFNGIQEHGSLTGFLAATKAWFRKIKQEERLEPGNEVPIPFETLFVHFGKNFKVSDSADSEGAEGAEGAEGEADEKTEEKPKLSSSFSTSFQHYSDVTNSKAGLRKYHADNDMLRHFLDDPMCVCSEPAFEPTTLALAIASGLKQVEFNPEIRTKSAQGAEAGGIVGCTECKWLEEGLDLEGFCCFVGLCGMRHSSRVKEEVDQARGEAPR